MKQLVADPALLYPITRITIGLQFFYLEIEIPVPICLSSSCTYYEHIQQLHVVQLPTRKSITYGGRGAIADQFSAQEQVGPAGAMMT
ncbi:hypothetical protein RvY_08997 [Ramazzottius varieornatus]|uniref:Uncharacterized protein n=1 Tax=Ramazzottius varieornatus TaxID=947166 RepID=A0A1D1VDF4_RAMVA|nr:hypothetical protein RvY_08997 [Ramazzottius varieornatus]